MVVETWGESQVAVGDTVTATVTVVREHAPEYQGLRRRCAACPDEDKTRHLFPPCFVLYCPASLVSARVGVGVSCCLLAVK